MAVRVRFFNLSRKNEVKSREAGYVVHDVRELIEFQIDGDPDNCLTREATARDRAAWPAEHARFKAEAPATGDGYPIDNWALPDVDQRQMLRDISIWTLEELIRADDERLHRTVRDGVTLKAKATLFLDANRDHGRLVEEMHAANRRIRGLEARIAELETGNADLARRLAAADGNADGNDTSTSTSTSTNSSDVLEGVDPATVVRAVPARGRRGN